MIKELLQNENIKQILAKAGISEDKAEGAVEQLMAAFQNKTAKDPKAMSSLISKNPNTPKDEETSKEVESDFLQGLSSKLNLPSAVTDQLKGKMPDILSQFSGILDSKGANNQGGLQSIFGHVTDLMDGKPEKGNPLGALFNRFFGKK